MFSGSEVSDAITRASPCCVATCKIRVASKLTRRGSSDCSVYQGTRRAARKWRVKRRKRGHVPYLPRQP
ncbi:hypothetical protein ACFPRL_16200 [Pseudoclavibacter helvolus]